MGREMSVVAPRMLLIGNRIRKSGPKQPVRTETRSDKRFIVDGDRDAEEAQTQQN